jgi:hypothetical protein
LFLHTTTSSPTLNTYREKLTIFVEITFNHLHLNKLHAKIALLIHKRKILLTDCSCFKGILDASPTAEQHVPCQNGNKELSYLAMKISHS